MATIDISMIIKAVNDASSNLRQVRDDVQGIGTTADRVSNQLRAIQVVMAGIVLNKAVQLGEAFLKSAVEIDNTRQRMVLAVGTFKEADEAIESINKQFEGTTANTDALTDSMIKLIQSGLNPEKARQVTTAIGQLSLNAKDSKTAIDNMTEGLVKLLARGQTDMRAFVSAFMQVPQAIGIIAKQSGAKFSEDFTNDVQKGAYRVNQIIDFMVAGANKSLSGLAAAQQNTIRGAFSLLTNAFGDSLRSLQDTPINDAIVERFKAVRKAIDDFVDGLKNLDPSTIERFFGALDNAAGIVSKVLQGLGPLAAGLATLAEGILKLLNSLPSEALTLGLIGYIFVGKAGAVAIAALTTIGVKALGEIGVKTDEVVAKITQYLPFGLLGLIIGGPVGAALATGAAATLDFLITKVGDIGIKLNGIQTKADQNWVDQRAQGKTSYDIIGGAISDAWNKNDAGVAKAKQGFNDIDKNAQATFDKMSKSLTDATNTRAAFLSQSVTGLGLQAPGGATSAVQVVDALQKELTQLRGNDAFQSLRNQALQYDQAVAKATVSVGLQKNLLEQQAQVLKENVAPSSGKLPAAVVEELNVQTEALVGRTQSLVSQYDKIAAVMRGDLAAEKVADVARAQGEWTKNAQNTLKTVTDLIQKYGNQTDVSKLLGLQKSITDTIAQRNELFEKEKSNAQTLGGLLQARLAMEQQALQLRAAQAELALKVDFNNDPVANLIKGTSAGQIMNQVLQQQLQLKQNILNYDLQINQLEQQRITASSAQAAIIDQTIAKYQTLRANTQAALANLSAEGVATNQLWQSIGNTIENGVVQGLSGLITHTMTLQQVGVQVFNALTQAAVKYLFQLLIIKNMGSIFGGVGSFMSGGGLLGGLFAANGAIVPSGVKMFANGGIIGGPTLFGMAGEAGTEAIMPLERVGGKLGVRTTGAGGGDVHVHLSAIDTQSGIEFLMKNTEAIQGLLMQRQKLNRGTKQVHL